MSGVKNHSLRYLGVVAVFCLICVIYLGRLFYIQISGREGAYEADTEIRKVTVQAVRGEIYDRNGKKLVANRYTYDLVLSYGRFSSLVAAQTNEVLLSLNDSLKACDATALHNERFFPFDGQYPYYSYNANAQNEESAVNYRLMRVLTRLKLEEDTTADELMRHYVDTYHLCDLDKEGNRLYNDDEVHALIRLYYDMDALDFRGNGEYVFASGIGLDDGSGVNLMTHVKEKSPEAVSFKGQVKRVYLYPGYASHILGSVGPIYAEEWEYYDAQGYQMNAIVGKDGCEAAFESYLHGRDGTLEIEVDANGNLLNVKTILEPVAGNDVYLTIDIDLQITAEEGLRENVEYVSGQSEGTLCDSGAAVAIDPNTFEVLALASYPTFDLTTFNEDYASLDQDPAKPLSNRALRGDYAPGSTLKLGMAAIALHEGVLSAGEVIACTGKYGGSNGVGCSTFGQNHAGGQNVFDAIAHSCNSFFCELGNRLGIRKMETYLSRLGLGKATGLELGGIVGILAGPTWRGEHQTEEPWQEPGMTWHAAIGQSDNKASPLQLACYTATIANGGTRYAAHLLYGVYAFGSTEPIKTSEVTVLDEAGLSESAIETTRKAMRQMASSDGGGVKRYFANLPDGVIVGGKTGTAQVGKGIPDNALFVCEATTDTASSEIVVSVVLEKGAHGYYAARTAGAILEAFYGE